MGMGGLALQAWADAVNALYQLNLDILAANSFDDFCHLEIHNLDQVVALKLVEDDHVIQAIQEFRLKHSF